MQTPCRDSYTTTDCGFCDILDTRAETDAETTSLIMSECRDHKGRRGTPRLVPSPCSRADRSRIGSFENRHCLQIMLCQHVPVPPTTWCFCRCQPRSPPPWACTCSHGPKAAGIAAHKSSRHIHGVLELARQRDAARVCGGGGPWGPVGRIGGRWTTR